MSRLPRSAERVLRHGALCHLAAVTGRGPHVTPVVFVLHGGRLWGTTSRRTVKARAWRADPRTGGLVVAGGRAVAFRGRVSLYDVLDPASWPSAVLRAPALARAWAGFAVKNAPFFAGYAVDARRVPFGWMPPGRVAFSVDLDAGAVLDLDEGSVEDRWGPWGSRVASRPVFRPGRGRLPALPSAVRDAVGDRGPAVLALDTPRGPVVLPARWARAGTEGACYAVLPRRFLALAGAPPSAPGGVVVDRASRWRASHMAGVLFRGPADVYVPDRVTSGRSALARRVRAAAPPPEDPGPPPDDPAVIRLRPRTAVWWRGWASGTVRRR